MAHGNIGWHDVCRDSQPTTEYFAVGNTSIFARHRKALQHALLFVDPGDRRRCGHEGNARLATTTTDIEHGPRFHKQLASALLRCSLGRIAKAEREVRQAMYAW